MGGAVAAACWVPGRKYYNRRRVGPWSADGTESKRTTVTKRQNGKRSA